VGDLMNVACIRAGIVVNVIVVDDLTSFITENTAYAESFDSLIPIGSDPGSPGIGWMYDGTSFTPPASS
jgi:uncharacterized protein (UPF0218 family)